MAPSGLGGGLRRNKTPPAPGRCLDTSDGIRKVPFPELFLALPILSAGNGPSQPLPAVWKNGGTGWKCCGAPLTSSWQGFCCWITGEAGSSIFRNAPAFRSRFSPALSLCHVLHLLWPHPCRERGCGGLRVAVPWSRDGFSCSLVLPPLAQPSWNQGGGSWSGPGESCLPQINLLYLLGEVLECPAQLPGDDSFPWAPRSCRQGINLAFLRGKGRWRLWNFALDPE